MFLLIDNSNDEYLRVVIKLGDKIIVENVAIDGSTGLLDNIDQLLRKNRLTLNELKGVAVVVGQGRFTLTRVAVTLANILAYALHIPVVGALNIKDDWLKKLTIQLSGQYLSARYSAEPNIGTQKIKLATCN